MHVHTWVFSRNNNQQYPRMTEVFKHSCDKQGLPITVHEMPTPPRTNKIIWADDNHYKLIEWAKVVTEATPGELLLISDSDMMCLKKPTEDMLSHVTSVAFTRRDPKTSGNIPVNAGMVVVRAGKKATEFFQEWVRRDTELYENPQKHTPYKRKYAGMNQASLGWMMEEPEWQAKVQWLECNAMNMVKPWRGWREAYFIHVKSGLRKSIFTGRKLDAPEELVNLWRHLEKEIGGTGEPEPVTYKETRTSMATRFKTPTQRIHEGQKRIASAITSMNPKVDPKEPKPTPGPRSYRSRRERLRKAQQQAQGVSTEVTLKKTVPVEVFNITKDRITIVASKWRRRDTGIRLASKVDYGVNHVRILKNMLGRHLSKPFDLVLFSDNPADGDQLQGVRVLPLWDDYSRMGGCLNRLHLFSEDMKDVLGKRFAHIDLDVCVAGDFSDVLSCTHPFLIHRYHNIEPYKTNNNQLYNGGFFMMEAGARKEVWEEFHRDPEAAFKYLKEKPDNLVGSGQAWVQHILGDKEPTVGPEHGFYEYRSIKNRKPDDAKVVLFAGATDPSQYNIGWVKECYQ